MRSQVQDTRTDIPYMMRTPSLLNRWSRRSTLLGTSGSRVECVPPSLRQSPDSAWQQLMFWLMAPAPSDTSPPLNQLPGVRTEFMAALADIATSEADRLRLRIHEARSLREMWHVRAELFRVVGLAYSQAEAEQRLLLLNRHFPTRAPRSQFAAH